MSEQWKVVVEPMPLSEAEKALNDWIECQRQLGRAYDVDEVRRDTIYSRDREELVRFAVRVND
ncbi:MAG: hypothetical protein DWQ34_06290 [Planctomycetota bacterium]|nr:MAG: hypothetical protein DWQ34_06290 [Planctomycetota bacterium]REK24246.1 MAG: hypothetical protein DWQ41_14530 [Planctomycetota bacterium]REK28769.1 MAG: hypothetical protein DWQ45_23990 [Planctomycetota bacterium]